MQDLHGQGRRDHSRAIQCLIRERRLSRDRSRRAGRVRGRADVAAWRHRALRCRDRRPSRHGDRARYPRWSERETGARTALRTARHHAPRAAVLRDDDVRLPLCRGASLHAPEGALKPRSWDDAEEIVPLVSAVVLSEDDVAGDLSAPRRWARNGRVYVTLAERGVLVLDRGTEMTVPGYSVKRVVDPTGAGDAFAAGLAIALADGRPADDCARFANAVASFAVEGVGMESLADRARVDARMR